ncbi:TPA: hypothetical protein U2C55_000066 [Streptococcus suis]|nr:hypothetical protein [Streptococcus suis]
MNTKEIENLKVQIKQLQEENQALKEQNAIYREQLEQKKQEQNKTDKFRAAKITR